jgi:translation initiation factor 3 subunit C
VISFRQVWDLFYQADRVRTMLVRKIQEESLRTYLFTHSSVYDSLSMATLSKMFELEQPTVHAIISKMVMNEELMVRIISLNLLWTFSLFKILYSGFSG